MKTNDTIKILKSYIYEKEGIPLTNTNLGLVGNN